MVDKEVLFEAGRLGSSGVESSQRSRTGTLSLGKGEVSARQVIQKESEGLRR